MKHSTRRILTTHVGSLIRPPELQDHMRARQSGKGFDAKAYETCLRDSVAEVVRQQAQAGIDVGRQRLSESKASLGAPPWPCLQFCTENA